MDMLQRLFAKASQLATRLDYNSCIIIVVGVVLVGFICMRGFGSRTDY